LRGRTQELDEFVLAFHGLDLRLVLRLVLFDAWSSSILGGAFEEFAVVYGVLGELSAVGLLAVVVEGGVGVVELAAGGVSALVEVDLSVLLACVPPSLPFTSRSKLKSSPLRLNSKSSSEPRELLPFGINYM
jgi:hypothetical protein